MNTEFKKDFYSLISEITKLEQEFAEKLGEYDHYRFLYYSCGKDNDIKMMNAKYEYETKKRQIEELTKQLSQLQLDDAMNKYYELYKEKSKLVKEVYNHQTILRNIGSVVVFLGTANEEEDAELEKERKNHENMKIAANNKILSINVEMSVMYPKVIYSNLNLKP